MKKYYYSEGNQQSGPFSLEDLRGHFIKPDTLIWYEGAAGWIPANQLPELSSIISNQYPNTNPPPPPAVPQAAPRSSYQSAGNGPIDQGMGRQQMNFPPKTWLVESILVTLFCCLPFGIAGIIYAGRVESRFYAGDTDGAIQASMDAAKWTRWGFWSAIILGGGWIVIMAALGLVGSFFSGLN